jgi:hypothetical protein
LFLLPKKEGGNLLVYFRFLSAQKLTEPTMQATATAATIANSVLINDAFEVDSIGIEVDAETED